MTKASRTRFTFSNAPLATSLVIALIIGGATFALSQSVVLGLLGGWVGSLVAFTFLECRALVMCSASDLKERAEKLDKTGIALVPISVCVACFSLLVCLLEVPRHVQANTWSDLLVGLHFILIFATVGASWMFVQTAFAVRYAHIYCTERAAGHKDTDVEPILFPGNEEPDGHDMLHFSIILGVATATADIEILSKTVRRLVTLHAIYSYFFNACVLALVINLTAAALKN